MGMGLTVKEMKEVLVRERKLVKAAINLIAQSRAYQKNIRADIKSEVSINRIVKADQRALVKAQREAKREAKRTERIAKMEAKLLALKSPKAVRKANQKASPVKVFSADEVAAFNENKEMRTA